MSDWQAHPWSRATPFGAMRPCLLASKSSWPLPAHVGGHRLSQGTCTNIVDSPRLWHLYTPWRRQRSPRRRPKAMRMWPGTLSPLGTTWNGKGVHGRFCPPPPTRGGFWFGEAVAPAQEHAGWARAEVTRQSLRSPQPAIICGSAVHLTAFDRFMGDDEGGLYDVESTALSRESMWAHGLQLWRDSMPFSVIPELLRATAHAFAELYRKTQQVVRLHGALEYSVAERTAALQQAHATFAQCVEECTAAFHREIAELQRLERDEQHIQHFAVLGRLA